MSGLLDVALSTEGFWFLIVASTVAGLVRGFSGFGTAMVFLPAASQVVEPIWALTIMLVMDMIGPLPNVPRALRDGHPGDVLRLSLGMIVALPFGIYVLTITDPDIFRYAVSIIALVLLIALVTGFRYRGELTHKLIYATGALGGLLAGCIGLAGPPVIMLYMASKHAASAIRANFTLYLICSDVALLALFGIWGLITFEPVYLGLMVTVPYLLGNVAGAAIFNPEKEKIYRVAAYVIIATSAVSGLPFWD